MRALPLAMLASALLAVPVALAGPVGGGTPGPFAGTITQDGLANHSFSNNPTGQDCIALAAPYTVNLVYAPPTDTLTLSAGGYTTVGSNGQASLHFQKGVCASFTVTVAGTSVADQAVYGVHVRGGVLAAGGGTDPCTLFTPSPC